MEEAAAKIVEDDAERVSTTDMVFRAVWECREIGRACTRSALQDFTRLPLTTIDDRIKYLRSIGRIRLAGGNVSGVYEPSEDPLDDRAVTISYLPGGRVKFEVGDSAILLTKGEAKAGAMGLAGITLLYRG